MTTGVDFETFWKAYPKKKGKVPAEKAWKKVPAAIQGDVLAAMQQQARQDQQFQSYPPNASTWLNQERWKDEIDFSRPSTARGGRNSDHFAPCDHDGRCFFRHNNTRCSLPGNWCPSARGAGPWYCLWHSYEANRGHGPEQDDYFRLYEKPENAREWAELHVPRETDRIREAILADNPTWLRMPSEAKSEYRARMSKIGRKLLGRIRERQSPRRS